MRVYYTTVSLLLLIEWSVRLENLDPKSAILVPVIVSLDSVYVV